MTKTGKRLASWLAGVLLCTLTLTSCMDEGFDTLVLPVPEGIIPASVIPDHLQDSLRSHGFVIHEGVNPPVIEGKYVMSPMVLHYASDGYYNTFYDLYITLTNQLARGLISYSERQNSSVEGLSIEACVIGSDSSFTMYCYQNISNDDSGVALWRCKTATVVSGQVADSGIRDCQYAFILLEKEASSDYYAAQLPDAETFRIFQDGDSLASRLPYSLTMRTGMSALPETRRTGMSARAEL